MKFNVKNFLLQVFIVTTVSLVVTLLTGISPIETFYISFPLSLLLSCTILPLVEEQE